MNRPWIDEYQEGVPADIDIQAYSSVVDMLDQSFRAFQDLTACECMDSILSYKEIDTLSGNFASYLQNTLDLVKGDRVAVMLPNLLQYPVAVFGILRAGMVVVNVNPLYTPYELEHQLKDAGAKAIVVLENFAVTLAPVISRTKVQHVVVTSIGEMLGPLQGKMTGPVAGNINNAAPAFSIPNAVSFNRALVEGSKSKRKQVVLQHADLAFLQYTGGTTGGAKGAALSHGNMIASVLQVQAWTSPVIEKGKSCVITPLPLYHIYPLANCLVYAAIGGKNILIPNPRDLPGLVQELKKHRFDALIGVNTLFNGLLNTPGFEDIDFTHLKLVTGAGAAIQRAVADKWKKLTGTSITEAYGLTETSPGVSYSPLHQAEWSGTVGLPFPSTNVALRDDDNGDVRQGEAGEICVKGPQVMIGYWQKPVETAAAFTPDGYFKTGDVAIMDDKGYLRIVDRKKDMILVSGFNVYPNEIEAAVALHPGVIECACIGVPDEKSGEAVKLFVVRRDTTLTAEELNRHCKQYLTGYKVPKHYEFRDALPKSPIGKILRKELRS